MGSEITPQDGTRAGTAMAVTTLGGTALADADYFTNTDHEYMYVNSSGGGTIYIVRTKTVDGNAPPDKGIAVQDGVPILLGPFPAEYFSSTNQVYISTGDTVTAGVIRI